MLALTLAASLVLTSPSDAPPQQATSAQEDIVRLDDIPVMGTAGEALVRRFVTNVAAPTRGRQVARWGHNTPICVGVANVEYEGARYLADRIGEVARELGLMVSADECTPNVQIVATRQPQALARFLHDNRLRSFVPKDSRRSLGRSAFRAFADSDAPIRWWHMSETWSPFGTMSVDRDGVLTRVERVTASRLIESHSDDLTDVFIIFDPARLSHLSSQQLADHLAFIALAQVRMDADTSAYDSILNVANYPDEIPGLTAWDRAYLAGLYTTQRSQKMAGAARDEIVASITRQSRQLEAADEE